jgi:hypothetical protein
MTVTGDILCKFLAEYPFASAQIMPRYFDVSASTVKEILIRELGFKRCTQRQVPCVLNATQKKHRQSSPIEMLKLLCEREPFDSNGITTGDESWFQYHYEFREIFGPSREQTVPSIRTQFGLQKL